MTDISDLFRERPRQWGMRGDPHLWDEMEARFRGHPLPARVGDLRTMLEAAFQALTGHAPAEHDGFTVRRFAREGGGMWNGMVSPTFWRDRALPLLVERWRAARASADAPDTPDTPAADGAPAARNPR